MSEDENNRPENKAAEGQGGETIEDAASRQAEEIVREATECVVELKKEGESKKETTETDKANEGEDQSTANSQKQTTDSSTTNETQNDACSLKHRADDNQQQRSGNQGDLIDVARDNNGGTIDSSQQQKPLDVEAARQQQDQDANEHQANTMVLLERADKGETQTQSISHAKEVVIDRQQKEGRASVGTSTVPVTETPEVSSTKNDEAPRSVRSSRRPSYNSGRGYAGGYQNYGLTYLPYKSNFEPSEDARRRADEFFKTLKL